MPARKGKSGGGRTAGSVKRRAAKSTATKIRGKVRASSARREIALQAAREHEARLDAWIASQAGEPAVLPASPGETDLPDVAVRGALDLEQAGAVQDEDRGQWAAQDSPSALGESVEQIHPATVGDWAPVVFTTGIVSDPSIDMLPMDADSIGRRMDWSLGDARQLVRSGYTPEHAAKMTGWPVAQLEDVKIGVW